MKIKKNILLQNYTFSKWHILDHSDMPIKNGFLMTGEGDVKIKNLKKTKKFIEYVYILFWSLQMFGLVTLSRMNQTKQFILAYDRKGHLLNEYPLVQGMRLQLVTAFCCLQN